MTIGLINARLVDVAPICRYGHGDMRRVEGGKWALVDASSSEIVTAFVVRMYRCPVCGYLEMLDEKT